MIMMPIALKTLKESQTQEREVLGDSFSAPSTFEPIVPTFFSPKPKKLFPANTVAGPSFSKGRNEGGVLEGPILFSDFFLVHSSLKVCMYTMHNFAFLEAIGPSIKSISHVFCLFLLVIICNTDQMICFHATLKSFFCSRTSV